MGMIDYLKERGEVRKYMKAEESAMDVFKRQQNSLLALKGQAGFKAIMEYWESVRDINEAMFEKASIADKDKYFALYRQSKGFIEFIKNMTEK